MFVFFVSEYRPPKNRRLQTYLGFSNVLFKVDDGAGDDEALQCCGGIEIGVG